MGNFQLYDALNILFELEKPLIKHLESFILLLREGGKLQKKIKIFNQQFQLKNSKESPHWISKS
jgi:hypothetical protein